MPTKLFMCENGDFIDADFCLSSVTAHLLNLAELEFLSCTIGEQDSVFQSLFQFQKVKTLDSRQHLSLFVFKKWCRSLKGLQISLSLLHFDFRVLSISGHKTFFIEVNYILSSLRNV